MKQKNVILKKAVAFGLSLAMMLSCFSVLNSAKADSQSGKVRKITFHRNPPADSNQQDETITVDIPGDKPVYGVSPTQTYSHEADWSRYFEKEYDRLKAEGKQPAGTRNSYAWGNKYRWGGIGEASDMLAGKPFYRTYAYNTKPDGSGTYYRIGYPLPENAPENLELYTMWAGASMMNSFFTEVQKVKPVIYLEENNKLDATLTNVHTSIEPSSKVVDGKTIKTEAYNVDKSMSLHYKAALNFSNIEDSLRVLWGRMDKIKSWNGYLKAILDKRLVFNKDLEITLDSTWQRVDPAKRAEFGATIVKEEGSKTTFSFSPDKLENMKNADGDYEINIPVTFIDKEKLAKLSFEDFMKPMWLSAGDNFEKGLSAVITDESYNKIATSDNPVIKAGGQINLKIVGDTGSFGGDQEYTNGDPKADNVYARLFPTGKLDIEFFTVDGEKLTSPVDEKGQKVSKDMWRFYGRSQHDAYSKNDPQNYANSFLLTDGDTKSAPTDISSRGIKSPIEILHPEIPGYKFVRVEGGRGFDSFSYKEDAYRKFIYEKIKADNGNNSNGKNDNNKNNNNHINKDKANNVKPNKKAPKTGDSRDTLIWFSLLGISLVGTGFVTTRRNREND